MSLYSLFMVIVNIPIYFFSQLIHLILFLIGDVLSIFGSFLGSITGFFFNAYNFVKFVINPFFPVLWVLSLLAGLMIVFSETIIYWAKKIWEVIGVILDML